MSKLAAEVEIGTLHGNVHNENENTNPIKNYRVIEREWYFDLVPCMAFTYSVLKFLFEELILKSNRLRSGRHS
jgi:hypothetical protein